MGVLDMIFGGGGKKKVHIWELTELGKQKAENLVGTQGLRLKIVSDIEEYGGSTIGEIANRIRANPEQVKATISQMYREGWVNPSKAGGA